MLFSSLVVSDIFPFAVQSPDAIPPGSARTICILLQRAVHCPSKPNIGRYLHPFHYKAKYQLWGCRFLFASIRQTFAHTYPSARHPGGSPSRF